MNWIDIVLAVPMVYMLYKGWRRGALREVATLAGLLIGIWAALHLSTDVAEMLSLEGETAVLAAFFICFVGALVLTYLVGRMMEKLMKAANISLLNHVAGAALGIAKALCVLAVLLSYLGMIDKNEALLKPEAKSESQLYAPVYNTGTWLTQTLKQYIDEHKEQWQEALKG